MIRAPALAVLTCSLALLGLPGCGGSGGSRSPENVQRGFVWFDSDRSGTSEIYRMRDDGTEVVQLTDSGGEHASQVSVSADGQVLVFIRGTGNATDVYAMDADGSNVRNLTNSPTATESRPTIRRDGSLIAYTRRAPGTALQVWTMNPDGSNPQMISDLSWSPAFRPDGARIAFSLGNAIATCDVDGRNVEQLTDRIVACNDPCWSPDGTRILYQRGTDAAADLWIMGPDGSGQRLLFDSGLEDEDGVFSADGQSIFFDHGNLPHDIMRVDANGLNATIVTTHGAHDNNPATTNGR